MATRTLSDGSIENVPDAYFGIGKRIVPPRFPQKLATLRDGDVFLVTCPYYWGKGTTLVDARKAVMAAGGQTSRAWRVYSVHPDTYLDEMGYIIAPKGHEPLMLAEHDPN